MKRIESIDSIPEMDAYFSCSMTGLGQKHRREIRDFLLALEKQCQQLIKPSFRAFIPYREEFAFTLKRPADYYLLDTAAVKKSKVLVAFDFHQLYSYGVGIEAKTADDAGKAILIASTRPRALSCMLTGMTNMKAIVELNGNLEESLTMVADAIKAHL